MWFNQSRKLNGWNPGLKHLSRDPRMRKIIAKVGICTLAPRRDYFIVLCKSIFTQQISTRIATILFGRFRELFPRRRPTPAKVVEVLKHDHHAKHCGLSKQKRAYLIDLAQHFVDGRIPTKRLARMSDDEIIEALTCVKGVGRWTAEMFLIFVLNRPDVWPVDDLGLREGVRVVFGMKDRPTAKELREIGEQFKPHRTLATWYFWRYLGLQTKARAK
jgi:DNA-3-methyladenine glycosylase II